ncbi:transcriptional regulator [Kitasatospora sp. NPDC048540]|uniref:hypothetical protein n=1 Tax=unclassified Kitasatospora TaxID=2633591 RepID=UPI000690E2D0|nr:hypothetical protein [Kitasatospora sp. MBT63]
MPATLAAQRLPRRRRSGCSPATVFETALTDLAAQRADGTMAGAAGTLHLVDGYVVHAESPAAASVEALLTGCGRLSAAEWAGHLATGLPMAEQLVRSGRVSRSELQLCQLTAVLDAAFFALAQDGGEIRFSAAARPEFTLARPMSVRELRAAVGRRRALLDRVWPCPQLDAAAVRRRPGAVPTACSRRRRAVLDAADGHRTPADIALLLGRSAFGTVLDIRHLAAGGLIESTAPPIPAIPPIPTVPPPRTAMRPAVPVGPPQVLLPTRPRHAAPQAVPVAVAVPVPVAVAVPAAAPVAVHPAVATALPYDPSDPHVALLLRIRAGLEARL